MSIPRAIYGFEVIPGDVPMAAMAEIPLGFRITMAAIDPSAKPEGEDGAPQRATLKIMRMPLGMDWEDDDEDDEDDEDEFDADEMERMLAEDGEDDDEDDEDDEAVNGGPSDPTKSKAARKAAAEKAISKLLARDGMDLDGERVPNGTNGVKKSAKAKGKMPASDDDEDEDEDDEDDEDMDDDEEVEEFVICTLDPHSHYQQPLDITVGENERVWFKVSGTHNVYLTGNYVEPAHIHDDDEDDEDDDDEYDLDPNDSELDGITDSEDELDDMQDPRITELEDEEAPKLVEAANQKKKAVPAAKANNKRPAEEEEPQTLDEMITQQSTTNGEPKLSKKQLKKMKKNDGTAAAAADKSADAAAVEAPSSGKASDKKVSFAKELEQGPTPTKAKPTTPAAADASKPTTGVKVVQGVTIDDKKLGSGPAAKKGDRVGMRYIGKLAKDQKVFDSNKKGKPFTFKLGAGEVIKGWDIGVQGMTVGGERRITIPAELAYGSKRTGDIPANSVLVFDVKMLELNKGK